MKQTAIVMAFLLILAACGGGDDGGASGDNGAGSDGAASSDDGQKAASGGGSVVDPQPPGQAKAAIDGQEFVFTEPGAVDCTVAPETLTFGFRIGDNEVTLGGGANLYDTGWLGGISVIVFNPEGEDAPIEYFIDLANNGDRIAIDGDSMSYSGPLQRNDPEDSTNFEGISAGDGTISLTCG